MHFQFLYKPCLCIMRDECNTYICVTWSIRGLLKGLVSRSTLAQSSGSLRRTRYRDKLLNSEFSLQTCGEKYKRYIFYTSCCLVAQILVWTWSSITNIYELLVTLSSLIGHTGQVRVSFLAVFPHHTAVIVWVLPQEAFWVVVAVDVDLGQGIVGSWLLTALVDTRLQPWQQQLQSAKERKILNSTHLRYHIIFFSPRHPLTTFKFKSLFPLHKMTINTILQLQAPSLNNQNGYCCLFSLFTCAIKISSGNSHDVHKQMIKHCQK